MMALSEKQIEQAKQALQEPLSKACPFCGGCDWRIADIVHSVPWQEGGAFTLGQVSIPLVLIACGGCWYVAQFSAAKLGLVEPEQEG
jgi:hypothetical protein